VCSKGEKDQGNLGKRGCKLREGACVGRDSGNGITINYGGGEDPQTKEIFLPKNL